MTRALYILTPIALAGTAYAAAQSLAAHDWLVAAAMLLLLAVGILLIVPGEETPEAEPDASPSFASAQHLHRAGSVVENGGAL